MSAAPVRPPARTAARLVVVLVALAVVTAACGSKASDSSDGVYVALGDSYTSGPGLTPVADLKCQRSKINYPSQVAKALHVSEFVDRSCGGAATVNLTVPQRFRSTILNAPQLNAIDTHTTLVTMGLGLNNDALSVGLLLVCQNPTGGPVSENCAQWLATPESTVEARVSAVAAQVGTALEVVHRMAPRARVVLVGYPRLVPDEGGCPDRLPIPDAQVTRMREVMRFADEAWRDTARKAGATYVDMYAASEGHDICSDDPWISGFNALLGQGARMHPNAAYHRAVADEVVQALTKK